MPANDEQPFNVLLQRAKAGDGAALGRLLVPYDAHLRAVAGALLRTNPGAAVDVSDVVQEANLRACGNIADFKGVDDRQLAGWLRRILANLVLNILRKQKSPDRRPQSLDTLLERPGQGVHAALTSPESTPSAGVRRRERAEATAEALKSLPPEYQQVLILRHLERLEHKEVGLRMGCTEGASRMLLSRASKALKEKLREHP